MDNGLMMKYQRQSMELYGMSSYQTHCSTINYEVKNIASSNRSSTVDVALGDVGYVSSYADTWFDINELLALIENSPIEDKGKIDGF